MLARLIILPMPPDKAEAAHRQTRKNAKRWGYQPSDDAFGHGGLPDAGDSLAARRMASLAPARTLPAAMASGTGLQTTEIADRVENLRLHDSNLIGVWIHAVLLVALLIDHERPSHISEDTGLNAPRNRLAMAVLRPDAHDPDHRRAGALPQNTYVQSSLPTIGRAKSKAAIMRYDIPWLNEKPRFPLRSGAGWILPDGMIGPGFLDKASRKDLIELPGDGSAARRLARRANALVLLDGGMSCAAIAKVLLLDDDTIRTWHWLYQEDGIEGLASFGHESLPLRRRGAVPAA